METDSENIVENGEDLTHLWCRTNRSSLKEHPSDGNNTPPPWNSNGRNHSSFLLFSHNAAHKQASTTMPEAASTTTDDTSKTSHDSPVGTCRFGKCGLVLSSSVDVKDVVIDNEDDAYNDQHRY
jgi:hypothetical protein